MRERRSLEPDPSPLKEDRGIFKTGVVDIRLDLSPLRRRSSRGDLVCIGFIEDTEVEVVFPGRRAADTGPLDAELSHTVRRARSGQGARLPLRARGIWRSRVVELDKSEAKRVYQFLVAEWTLRNTAGLDTTYGELPRR